MQKDITRLYRVNSSLRVFGSTQRVSRAFFSSSNTSMHKLDAEPHSMSTSGQPFRVIFGSKLAAEHLGHLARSSGIHKMLLVRDNDPSAASRAQYIEFLLMQAGIPCFQYTLKRDCATIEGVDDGVAVAQRVGANGVLAFGGGSSMDMTRAIALLISNGGSANEYMRGEMKKENLDEAAPHIILPTIAGCGAEISPNSLVLDEDSESKSSFSPIPINAEAVLIDPMLALTVPTLPTAQGALTSLGQCIESYLAGCGDDKTNHLALQGIEAIASGFAQPLVDGKFNLRSVAIREKFALGSLLSGICANASGFGGAHALAVSMGGVSHIAHMQVCASFLPLVLSKYSALAEENQGDPFFDEMHEKLTQISTILTSASGFQGTSLTAWVEYVTLRFGLSDVVKLELDQSLVNGIVERTMTRLDETTLNKPEPILEKKDIESILEQAITISK